MTEKETVRHDENEKQGRCLGVGHPIFGVVESLKSGEEDSHDESTLDTMRRRVLKCKSLASRWTNNVAQAPDPFVAQ